MKSLRFAIVAVLLAVAMVGAALAQNTFRILPESGGAFSSFMRLPPTYIDARVLAANVAESHTIPAGVKWLVLSSSCAAFYAKPNATAAVPAADVTDGTGSELNPAGYYVGDIATLGLIAPATCVVTMSFYK